MGSAFPDPDTQCELIVSEQTICLESYYHRSQPAGGQHIIYVSDLWFAGSTNQARAPLHLEPVSVGNRTIGHLTCSDSFDLDIVVENGKSSSLNQTRNIDATSGTIGFDYACDLPPLNNLQSGARIQAWYDSPSRVLSPGQSSYHLQDGQSVWKPVRSRLQHRSISVSEPFLSLRRSR